MTSPIGSQHISSGEGQLALIRRLFVFPKSVGRGAGGEAR
jgi:hypothetical protein